MDLYALLDELQTIARNGLQYATNPYDRERYDKLLNLATGAYAELLDVPGEALLARFKEELGYITPKVGADAAIFNPRGEILLMERADGSGWCLPCGFVEPNERPVETAIREAREETGLEIQALRLVGVFTRMPNAINGPHTTIGIVHLCEIVGGKLKLSPEGLDLRYWKVEEVPRWHPNHDKYARAAYRMWEEGGKMRAVSD